MNAPLRMQKLAYENNKLEKRLLDRRLSILSEEGVIFRTSCNIGVDVPVDRQRIQTHESPALLRRQRAAGARRG